MRLPTFMEIAGCADKENACSKVLAFFFDPAKPHGLGILFLDALARIGGIQNQTTIAGIVKVDREEYTDAGNRIDLLIQSDNHAILIENKISSRIDNPFDDYAAHLDSLPQAHKHKILLTLKSHREDVGYEFRNITYEQLVKKIRELLGDYVAGADTRYLTFMLDFLNTLDNLQKDRVMDKALLDLLEQRGDDVENFLNEIKGFKEALRKKTKELCSLLPDLRDPRSYPNVTQWFYGKHIWGGGEEDSSLYDALGYDIELASFESSSVVVSAHVEASGWGIQFYPRKRNNANHHAKLRHLLDKLEIPLAKEKEESTTFLHLKRFDFAESLDRIHPVVRDVVHKLATSGGAS